MHTTPKTPFDTDATQSPGPDVPVIAPWRRVALDAQFGGSWIVAGDLDGDGQAEIVSAQNFDRDDVHHTTAVCAQRLDGSVLWRWGDPTVGRRKLHHDVACQIYDWDGDGCNEVILCHERELIELDGATGRQRRSIPIPPGASDSIVFANLSGGPHAREVLVKDRYERIWALDHSGKLLWHIERPGGHRTAHQPLPIDINGDGRDEIMAGFALLNPDGSVRWVHQSSRVDLSKGHLDCMRPLRLVEGSPGDSRLVITCCGSDALAMIDGRGKMVWEITGHHFESIDIGKVSADVPGLQIVVDIDRRPWGQGPLWLIDETGRQLGRIMTNYCRHHDLIHWPGSAGTQLIAIGGAGLFDARGERVGYLFHINGRPYYGAGLFNGRGERVATLQTDPADGPIQTVRPCRFNATATGLLLGTEEGAAAYAFVTETESAKAAESHQPIGTGVNLTLY